MKFNKWSEFYLLFNFLKSLLDKRLLRSKLGVFNLFL